MTLALPSRTPGTRQIFAALGRALFVATSFETDCRVLAFALKLRDPFLKAASVDEFERFIHEPVLAKLVKNVQTIVGGMALSENFDILLSNARESRNFIAHEAAENLDEVFHKADVHLKWQATIDSKIREVARGKLVVALLFPKVSAAIAPDRKSVETYVDQVSHWVFVSETDA